MTNIYEKRSLQSASLLVCMKYTWTPCRARRLAYVVALLYLTFAAVQGHQSLFLRTLHQLLLPRLQVFDGEVAVFTSTFHCEK